MANDVLLYVGQKAFIERDGKVLILHDWMGLDFPGGKLQEGEIKDEIEDIKSSLKREVREETNMEVEVEDPFVAWYHKFPEQHKYFGKAVYLVGFKCKHISGEFKMSDEHNTFEWVDKNDYEKLDDDSGYFYALKKYFLLKK